MTSEQTPLDVSNLQLVYKKHYFHVHQTHIFNILNEIILHMSFFCIQKNKRVSCFMKNMKIKQTSLQVVNFEVKKLLDEVLHLIGSHCNKRYLLDSFKFYESIKICLQQ